MRCHVTLSERQCFARMGWTATRTTECQAATMAFTLGEGGIVVFGPLMLFFCNLGGLQYGTTIDLVLSIYLPTQ